MTWSLFRICLVLTLPSCVTIAYVDWGARISVCGRVFDAESQTPVEGATVVFVDRGLAAGKKHEPLYTIAGYSDADGNVQVGFDYRWGKGVRLGESQGIHGNVEVIVMKQGYIGVVKRYALEDEQREDGVFQLNLGNLEMKRWGKFLVQ
jgi:hypothetical protein